MRRLSHRTTGYVFIALAAILSTARAQEVPSPSAFSLMLNVGFNGPASKAMRGARDTFATQFARSFTALEYPFGDNLATSSTWEHNSPTGSPGFPSAF